MRNAIRALLWVLLAAAPLAAQAGMPTLEAAQFSRLENRLFEAVQKHDGRALASLLADDFEMREAGVEELTLREEWLERTMRTDLRTFSIGALAPRPFGAVMVVSLVLRQESATSGRPAARDLFIVDVWRRAGGNWRLAARYASPAQPAPAAGKSRTKQ